MIRGETSTRLMRGEFSLSAKLCTDITGNIKGEKSLVAAIKRLDFDFYGCLPHIPQKELMEVDNKGRQVLKDHWGRVFWRSHQGREQLVEYPIQSLDDIKRYSFPRVDAVTYHHQQLLAEQDLYLFGVVDGVFQSVARLMDLLDFLALLKEQPETLTPLFQQAAAFNSLLVSELSNVGVDAILVADDVAHYGGLFCPAEGFLKWVAPWEEQIFSAAAAYSKPAFFHSDGNISSLLGWLAGSVTGIHSLDKCPGMDLKEIVSEYARQLVLMGGVAMEWLYQEDVSQVENAVSLIQSMITPETRYVLSSTSGFLTEDLNPRALEAMYRSDNGKELDH